MRRRGPGRHKRGVVLAGDGNVHLRHEPRRAYSRRDHPAPPFPFLGDGPGLRFLAGSFPTDAWTGKAPLNAQPVVQLLCGFRPELQNGGQGFLGLAAHDSRAGLAGTGAGQPDRAALVAGPAARRPKASLARTLAVVEFRHAGPAPRLSRTVARRQRLLLARWPGALETGLRLGCARAARLWVGVGFCEARSRLARRLGV